MTLSAAGNPAVVIIGELSGAPPRGIDRVAHRVELRYANTADELRSALSGAEIALLWDFRSPVLREVLGHADALRWIHVAGAGVDAVLSPELAARDIVVTNARGVFDRSIAETVAGMALMFAKDLRTTIELQRQRIWRHRETEILAGQTALVVGVGQIGRRIAATLAALGVEVTGVATRERPDPELGAIRSIADLDELLPDADFVILVVPLTDETRGLMGASRLSLMKPSARLINVGRGGLVDEAALIAALRASDIAGAALDVFEREPLPEDHPFWSMSQVLVSPHMSADFRGWLDALAEQFMDQLDRWLEGGQLANVVDKELGYVSGEDPSKDPSGGGGSD